MGVPRYLATVVLDDLERTLAIADELLEEPEAMRKVALVHCGRASHRAEELGRLLSATGRTPVSLIVTTREQAQAPETLRRLSGASAVWVFVENLFEAFMTVFATQLTFAMRSVTRQGMPVIGVGGGALALGGLMLAQRICSGSQYELVSGLGWAPRVLLDGGADRSLLDAQVARESVCSLPGLLGVDVGLRGGVQVLGGRVRSVGNEPIILFGTDDSGKLLKLELDPGATTTIAPPPFAPFTSGLLPAYVLNALKPDMRPVARTVPRQLPVRGNTPNAAGNLHGRVCPMCNKVHHPEKATAEPALALAS